MEEIPRCVLPWRMGSSGGAHLARDGNFFLFSHLPDTLRRKSPGAQLNVSLISRGEKVEKAAAWGPSSFFHPAKRQSWREQSAGETLLSAPPIWLMCKWGRRKICAGTQSVKKLFCPASERWKAAAIKKKIPITAKWFPSLCDSLWRKIPWLLSFSAGKLLYARWIWIIIRRLHFDPQLFRSRATLRLVLTRNLKSPAKFNEKSYERLK